ncbi:OsmC family protein [Jeotgalibaca caeni]|uniref:OsmC family protein n=1 Tax=Jeotgalibaca caeni TaxID=3028623 RepID=UPI00237EB595|nr:OsmC family protein [Jeotgalibaca caeni]MDE1548798.1 OsmC family protein [Jeotgalibaca caeni]
MSEDALFHTEVVNDKGLEGEAYVKDGLRVLISSPLSPDEGSNPEELLGLSWSTCLNSTIQALLKGRSKQDKSKVEVHVDFKREPNGIGYYFTLAAFVSIENHTIEETTKVMHAAHKRCPVSKIIGSYEHVSLQAVPFER